MTSSKDESRAVLEPLYSGEVFERLRRTLDVQFTGDAVIAGEDIYIKPNYEVREDGAWLRANGVVDVLDWTPSCDVQEGPGSPDPLTTPALPFPFTARQLAAFFMGGWGWFLHARFVDESGELDQEIMQALLGGVRDAKPREAIAAAFTALTQARQSVGAPDASLAVAEQAAWTTFSNATKEAEGLHNWRESGLSEQERRARVQRRNETTAAAKALLEGARNAHDENHAAWRKKMVLRLLGAGHGKLSRAEWEALSNNEKAATSLARRTPAASLEDEHQGLTGWYDQIIRANYWLGLASITATEAAQLLSCVNPHDAADVNWLQSTTEHMNPESRRELLRGFEDEGGRRPLTEWLQRAKSRGWRYDPWIDQYIEAAGVASTPFAVPMAARPLSRAVAQETAILAKFKALDIDPMRLPRPKPGKSSPPVAKARSELRYSPDVMQKAMARLFQDGRAAYSALG